MKFIFYNKSIIQLRIIKNFKEGVYTMEKENENTSEKSPKGFFANLSDKFWKNIRSNRFFENMFCGIIYSIIAVLIAGLTFGLGTVSIASSIFLGFFTGRAIDAFVSAGKVKMSFLDSSKDTFIFAFLIASIFTLATVLIGTLTFGFGLIPLGIFAATSLTTALGTIAFFKLNQSLFYYSDYKRELRSKAQEELMKPSQVYKPIIDEDEKDVSTSIDDLAKPNNLEEQQQENNEPNFHDDK